MNHCAHKLSACLILATAYIGRPTGLVFVHHSVVNLSHPHRNDHTHAPFTPPPPPDSLATLNPISFLRFVSSYTLHFMSDSSDDDDDLCPGDAFGVNVDGAYESRNSFKNPRVGAAWRSPQRRECGMVLCRRRPECASAVCRHIPTKPKRLSARPAEHPQSPPLPPPQPVARWHTA